jgi:ABC-type phosphate transport system substrate-binding protein
MRCTPTRQIKLILAIGILAVFLSPPHLFARDTSIAVIVNPGVGVESVSLTELRNIFLGTQTFWKDGTPVVAFVRAPSARERSVLLSRVLHMTENQYQQYWRKQRQSGKRVSEPVAVVSNGMQMEAVLRHNGAVALVSISDVQQGVKVLKVAGHLPGSAAYPLKTSAAR